MSNQFTESVVEDAALEWFGELGYRVVHGPEIAPGEAAAERENYEQVMLTGPAAGRPRSAQPRRPARGPR